MHFRPSFLSAFGVTLAVCLSLALAVGGKSGGPQKPPFPAFGATYVSAYSRGHADHYLFKYGIFGFAERIRKADILVIGSSHPQFGLSAACLGGRLIDKSGRPATAFNMALGHGEGMGFARRILDFQDVHDKTILVDVYAPLADAMSPFATGVDASGLIGAYASTASIWVDFARDWLFDGILPRYAYTPGSGFSHRRFLGLTTFRDWNSGDFHESWHPDNGAIYRQPPAHVARPYRPGPAPAAPNGGINIAADLGDILRNHDLRPIFTLLPYRGDNPDLAERLIARWGPFLRVPPDGLTFVDNDHLSSAGRRLATEAILRSLGTVSTFESVTGTSCE